jgi:hypothetical protein
VIIHFVGGPRDGQTEFQEGDEIPPIITLPHRRELGTAELSDEVADAVKPLFRSAIYVFEKLEDSNNAIYRYNFKSPGPEHWSAHLTF